jgi:hypothetical protein
MSSINDLIVSEKLTSIAAAHETAAKACRRGNNEDAFKAFMAIERYAHDAQARLNDLKYRESAT